MKFTRNGSVQLIAGAIIGVGAVVVACGGDDDTTGNTPATDGGASSSGGSSGTASSSGGSSGTASSSGGSSGTPSDAGGDGGGGDGGAKKANGVGPCAGDMECQSGTCFIGGKESFCTIKCQKIGETDPVCTALGNKFSGQCNKKGFCETN